MDETGKRKLDPELVLEEVEKMTFLFTRNRYDLYNSLKLIGRAIRRTNPSVAKNMTDLFHTFAVIENSSRKKEERRRKKKNSSEERRRKL